MNIGDLKYEQIDDLLMDMIREPKSIREIKNMSQEHLDSMYFLAHTLYKAKNYKKAELVFKQLCIFDHLNARYYLGYGATMHKIGKFETAINAYSAAFFNDPEDYNIPYNAGLSHLALEAYDKAKEAFLHAKEILHENNKKLVDSKHIEKQRKMIDSLVVRCEGLIKESKNKQS